MALTEIDLGIRSLAERERKAEPASAAPRPLPAPSGTRVLRAAGGVATALWQLRCLEARRPRGDLGWDGFFDHQLRNHVLHQVWTSPEHPRLPWLCPQGGEDSLRSVSGPRRRGQGREGWGCEAGRAYRGIRSLQHPSGPCLRLFPTASPSSPLLRCRRTSSARRAKVSRQAGRLSLLCLTRSPVPSVPLSFPPRHPSTCAPLRLASRGAASSAAAVLQLCKLCPSDPPSAQGGRERGGGEVR